MAITITITGDTPLEALATLTACGILCMSDKDVATAADRIYETEMQKEVSPSARRTVGQTGPKDAPEPTPNTPEEPYVEDPPHGKPVAENPVMEPPEPQTDKANAAPAPRLEDVRAAGIEAARKYGNAKVKAILEHFGAANMTTLAESDRAAFLEKLKGLGEADA